MIKIKPVILFIGNNYADVVSITAVGSGIVNGKLITNVTTGNYNLTDNSEENIIYLPKTEKPVEEPNIPKYAKWIVEENMVTCSGCQKTYDSDFEVNRKMVLSFKFCPDCGRKIIKR